MINFQLGQFWDGYEFLIQELNFAQHGQAQNRLGSIPLEHYKRLKENIQRAMNECVAKLLLKKADQVCIEIENLFRQHERNSKLFAITYGELTPLLERLVKDINRELHFENFFIIHVRWRRSFWAWLQALILSGK